MVAGLHLIRAVRKVAPVAIRYRRVLLTSLTITLLGGCLQLVLPLGIKRLFDSITVDVRSSQLGIATIALVVIFTLRATLTFVAQYYAQTAGETITKDMRYRLLRHYSDLSREYHLSNPSSEIVTHIYSDASEVRNILAVYGVSLAAVLVQTCGAIAIMAAMNWRLAIVVMILGPLATVVTVSYGRALHGLGRDIKDRLVAAMVFAQEYIANAYVVKIFDQHKVGLAVFEDRLTRHYEAAVTARRLDASRYGLITLLTALSTIGIFWFGGRLVQSGQLSPGELVAFFLYSQAVSQDVANGASTLSALSQATGAVDRLFKFLDEPRERALSEEGIVFDARNAQVDFEDVSFSYNGHTPVLQHLSFRAKPGATILAKGPSGAGKSTLLSLIMRFNDPTEGRVLLNGVDLRMYDVASLRSAISIVAQDVMMFSTTIIENIRLGNPDASDEDVVEAAKVANAHDFIVALSEGYNTYVGERAVQLSGGQRQRLSIARAVVRNAPILILDEATSAVDDEGTSLIIDALNRVKAGRTTFVVSHREIGALAVNTTIDLTCKSSPSSQNAKLLSD